MGAETWRVVDFAGVVGEVTVRCVWESPDDPRSRWRLEAPGMSADIDCDEDDTPREALCRWAAFRVAEIRGPGEATTAEQLAEKEAEIARLRAALWSYMPSCERYVRLDLDDHARRRRGPCGRNATHYLNNDDHTVSYYCRRHARRLRWANEYKHSDVVETLTAPEREP